MPRGRREEQRVEYLSPRASTSAPRSIRSRIVLADPRSDARRNGVKLLSFCALTCAPCSSSSRTASEFPVGSTICNGVEHDKKNPMYRFSTNPSQYIRHRVRVRFSTATREVSGADIMTSTMVYYFVTEHVLHLLLKRIAMMPSNRGIRWSRREVNPVTQSRQIRRRCGS